MLSPATAPQANPGTSTTSASISSASRPSAEPTTATSPAEALELFFQDACRSWVTRPVVDEVAVVPQYQPFQADQDRPEADPAFLTKWAYAGA